MPSKKQPTKKKAARKPAKKAARPRKKATPKKAARPRKKATPKKAAPKPDTPEPDPMPGDASALDPKELVFALEYLGGSSLYDAAIKAGYSESMARKATIWVRKGQTPETQRKYKPHVVAFIQGVHEARRKTSEVNAQELLRLHHQIATMDVAKFHKIVLEPDKDANGNEFMREKWVPKSREELPPELRPFVVGYGPDGPYYHKVTIPDRQRSLDYEAKLLGAYKNEVGFAIPAEILEIIPYLSDHQLRMLASGKAPGVED